MKIALVHDSVLPPKHYGGIERVVLSLAAEYTRLGQSVIVVCRQGSRLPQYETITLPEGFRHEDVTRALPADCDFLHFHQPLRTEPAKPYLVTIHGNGQAGETYLSNTNFLSRSHARNHGGTRFVHNGVDVDDFPFQHEKEDYFVFLARAKWRVKNLNTAIAMCRDLGMRLEVMGGSGLSTRHVKYHGSINEAQGKLDILKRAKALLYPTNWDEPFGLALLEAWACGTPVISSVNGAMEELVQPQVGFKCPTYAEFLEAGRKIGTVQPRVCRDYVAANFSATKMAEDYIRLIKEILENGPLKQKPSYAFDKASVRLLYKPTLKNRLRLALTGKV